MHRRNLLFVDCETTGLSHKDYELIEIGAVLTTPDGKTELDRFEAKVPPHNPRLYETMAAQVNGYDPNTWMPDMAAVAAAERFSELAKGHTLVGQNSGFDEKHLTVFLERWGVPTTWHYHTVDCVSLAWPLLDQGKITSVSLNAIRGYFNLPKEATPHRAIRGVEAVREAYLKLMELYGNIAL